MLKQTQTRYKVKDVHGHIFNTSRKELEAISPSFDAHDNRKSEDLPPVIAQLALNVRSSTFTHNRPHFLHLPHSLCFLLYVSYGTF